jgi:hypothetical protein
MSQGTENPRHNSLFRNILPASPYGSRFWAYLDPYQTRKLQTGKILAERHKKKCEAFVRPIRSSHTGSGDLIQDPRFGDLAHFFKRNALVGNVE